ncbi:hypothetical protein JCM19239_6044 [Vibrio variabilis]|uniref:Uncharacterized protein n=1 Tax=Vibrio variabilis TaxID=990271 RepID=A0ABQ0JLR2_9VIBR|nr:hypothetical protein JCM19239_6044 [Vibrio variabilis]
MNTKSLITLLKQQVNDCCGTYTSKPAMQSALSDVEKVLSTQSQLLSEIKQICSHALSDAIAARHDELSLNLRSIIVAIEHYQGEKNDDQAQAAYQAKAIPTQPPVAVVAPLDLMQSLRQSYTNEQLREGINNIKQQLVHGSHSTTPEPMTMATELELSYAMTLMYQLINQGESS